MKVVAASLGLHTRATATSDTTFHVANGLNGCVQVRRRGPTRDDEEAIRCFLRRTHTYTQDDPF